MGSRRSNPSVKPGQKNPIDSNTIRSSSLRDYTPSAEVLLNQVTPDHRVPGRKGGTRQAGPRSLGGDRKHDCRWPVCWHEARLRIVPGTCFAEVSRHV